MHCPEIRDLLPLHLYGDLSADQAAEMEKHLAECGACRRDWEAHQATRPMLDAVAVPAVQVDLPRIYAESARQQQRRLRRWQYAAAAFALAASILFVALALKLEVRAEAHQVTVRWGVAPTGPPVASATAPPTAANPEELQLVKDLLRAVAGELEVRDERRRQELALLQSRLDVLQRQNQRLWATTERDMAAVVALQLKNGEKGAQ